MAAKRGRPASAQTSYSILIRLSENDKKMLEECCENLDMPKVGVIRNSIRLLHKTMSNQK